jgi:DNA-binding helix-hairpin-helix protein with protein kinase domain
MKVVQTASGSPVPLTPLGKGGAESEIYRVSPGVLAAICIEEPSADRIAVVEALTALTIPNVALPRAILFDCGQAVGWTMPEIVGHHSLENFFLPSERARLKIDFDSQRFAIAKCLVDLFITIQKADIAVVDHNPANYLFATSFGKVTGVQRIDVAAGCGFTVNHRPIPASAVVMPDFLPRECIVEFRSGSIHTWGEDQAAGALACLLFKVFTGGSTLDHGEPGAPADLIEAGKLSIFGVEPNSEVRRQFDSLPPVIRSYLEQAITGPAGRRPTLAMWETALGMAPSPKRAFINWRGLVIGLSTRCKVAGRSARRRKFACLTVGAAMTLAFSIFQNTAHFRWTIPAVPTFATERVSVSILSTQHENPPQTVVKNEPTTAVGLWHSPEPSFRRRPKYQPNIPLRLWRDQQ